MAACSEAVGKAQAARAVRSWRKTSLNWLGGLSPSGWSGRKVAHASGRSRAQSWWLWKKHCSQLTFARARPFAILPPALSRLTFLTDRRPRNHKAAQGRNGSFRYGRVFPDRPFGKTPLSAQIVSRRRADTFTVMEVLLTGASGAIGSELAPALAAAGCRVRALARRPERVEAAGIAETMVGDLVTGAGVREALEGMQVAYYLVHSMEPGDESFAERERRAAAGFAEACRKAGVRRVCYLGGLVPAGAPASEHLSSRLAVEEILLEAAPEAVALRASIVIGARSRSFRFLVRLLERSPVLPLPSWRDNRTQPIDSRDVTAFLVAAGTSPAVTGPLSLDIAGPDVVTYGQLVARIADQMLIDRPPIELPFSATPLAGPAAAALADEDPELIGPLMEGLGSDLLPRDTAAAELFGVRLHRLDRAIAHALRRMEADEPVRAR